jgi:hypothetical protein
MLVASGASLGNLKEPTATSIASSVIAFMALCVAERCVARQAIADDAHLNVSDLAGVLANPIAAIAAKAVSPNFIICHLPCVIYYR